MLSQVTRKPMARLVSSAKAAQFSSAPNIVSRFIENLTSSTKMPRVPLNIPFDGVQASTSANPTPVKPVSITKLANGLRVVSFDTNAPVSSVGLFVDAGSRYEDDTTAGISYILEQLAFKSTGSTSAFNLIRDSAKRAVNISSSASRDHMVYVADGLRDRVPYAVKTLRDITLDPAFVPWEVQEVVENIHSVRQPTALPDAVDSLHSAAYRGQTLGRQVFPAPGSLSKFTPELLEQYHNRFYVPNRMILSGVGVEHEQLLDLANQYFHDSAAGENVTTEKAVYRGGERQHHVADDASVTFGVAFEGANWHHPLVIPMTVLQTIVGGGGSFSAGGPGKGMCSRSYQNLLNRHEWLMAAQSFHSVYNDSALFGLYATAPSDHGAELATAVTRELVNLAGPLAAEELSRAKNQLKSAVYMHLESRSVLLEDMARQLWTYGKVHTPSEVCALIDKVTEQDVRNVAKLLLASQPTVVGIGNTSRLPNYTEVVNSLKL